MDNSKKRIVLLTIKYAPAFLSLTCSVKILLLTAGETDKTVLEWAVNWINWVMNVLAVLFFCCCGRYLGYCWKHRSLCRTALWGLMYYASFLLFQPPHEAMLPIVIMYMITVVVMTILYKEL